MLTQSCHRVLLAVSGLALAIAGCGSPVLTDENDPLPRVFGNKDLDPSQYRSEGMMGMMDMSGDGGVESLSLGAPPDAPRETKSEADKDAAQKASEGKETPEKPAPDSPTAKPEKQEQP